ncbi:MAG: cadherin-like beta sandwich domain-containing protein [Verrucomicrobia bacterium]|nr:cadherin-like beta sandwich domain-containing protein [Verrucomicrobiota bacterium]
MITRIITFGFLMGIPLMSVLPVSAGTVTANFTSAATVPVTAASYTATGNTVDITLNFSPPAGTNLTVVNNTGMALIQGTFENLAQGQRVNLTYGGYIYPFVATYFGGTGNDVVLLWANTRMLAWGGNASGQLGNGGTSNTVLPGAVNRTGVLANKTVIAISSGYSHTLVLCADGTLAAWGAGSSGELGNGTSTSSNVPVPVDQSGVLAGKTVVAIATGNSHNLALCADGTLASWGYNSDGQLGRGYGGSSNVPVLVDRTGVLAGKSLVAVSGGFSHSLALCADGTVASWGSNAYGELGNGGFEKSYVPVLANQSGVLAGKSVVAIGAGNSSSLVLCSDGTMAAWGFNLFGQLGNGSTTDSHVPVLVNQSGVLAGKTVSAIVAGFYYNLALCSDGSPASWGSNSYGQLGNSVVDGSKVPVWVTKSGVLADKTILSLTADYAHSTAVCSDGTMATWGYNTSGQLGNGTTANSSAPVLVTLSSLLSGERIIAGASGSSHTHALVATPPPPAATTQSASAIADFGATLNGTMSANGASTTVSFQYGLTKSYGATVAATPATVTGTTVTAVAASIGSLTFGTTYHYRVVATSQYGTTLGDDMTFTTTTLTSLAGLSSGSGTLVPRFSILTLGYEVTVPNTASTITLTPVTSSPAATVKVNGSATASGTACTPINLTEGRNTLSVVVTAADGITKQTYTVTAIRLPAAFVFNSAADVPLTANGFTATGCVADFQLNYAPATGSNLAVLNRTDRGNLMGAFSDLAQGQTVTLTYGGIHYAFVVNYYGGTGNDLVLQWANTRLLAWGANFNGNLGNNGKTSSFVPLAVNASGVLAGKTIITTCAGSASCLAWGADGALAAWGSNSSGQLGVNDLIDRYVPAVSDPTGVLFGKSLMSVTGGGYHYLALCTDGTLAAWGDNSYGQLGNNSTTNSKLPGWVDPTGALAGRTVVAIAAGDHHSLALCADGTLAAWGNNGSGQLGDNSTTRRTVPVVVNQTGVLAGKSVVAIAAGGDSSLALCSDGTVAAWGYNYYGQLGNNSTTNSSVPVPVNQSGMLAGKVVTAVAAGSAHAVALCSDGTLAAWGYNNSGQLGNASTNNSSVPVLVSKTGVLSGKTVVAVTAGDSHSLALCSNGTVAAWGYNYYGMLGNGTITDSSTPVTVNTGALQTGESIVGVEAGYYHNLAVVASPPAAVAQTLDATNILDIGATLNATVNANGTATTVTFEYGLTQSYGLTVAATPATVAGTTATVASAVLSGLLSGTTYHYRVVGTSPGGTMTGGDMIFTTSSLATLSGLSLDSGVLTPSYAGITRSYITTVSNAVSSVIVTPVAATPATAVTINGITVVSGTASAPVNLTAGENMISIVTTAEDGINTQTYVVRVTRLPQSFTFNSAAEAALTANDFVATGLAPGIELNHAPPPGTTLTVVRNTGNRWIQGAFANLAQGQSVTLSYAGVTYAFAVNYFGGTGNDLVLQWANNRLLAWGSNGAGCLGNNSTTSSKVPVAVDNTGVLAGKTVTTLSAGGTFGLALCAGGTLASWGSNTYGQLGNNSTTNSSVPVMVDQSGVLADRTVVAVAAGGSHSLALCSDGTLAAWGYNNYGQLGNNGTTNGNVPVQVDQSGVLAGKSITAIAAGDSHCLALCADGTLCAWGSNNQGQLGDDSNNNSSVPVAVNLSGVLAGRTITAVSAGGNNSMALCVDGSLATWGMNGTGQLGNNNRIAGRVPVLVTQSGVLAGKTVSAISTGDLHSVVGCTDGTLAAWGYDSYGGLGNNSTLSSNVAVLVTQTGVLAGKAAIAASAGYHYSHALCSDGTLAAWGRNDSGQLGNNSTTQSNVPVLTNTDILATGERISAVEAGNGFSLAMAGSPPPPAVTTLAATGITDTGAVLNGTVNAAGTITTLSLEYGLTSSYGASLTADPSWVGGAATSAASATLGGLIPGTTYHYRVVASRSRAMFYGADMTFTTTTLAVLSGVGVNCGMLTPAFDGKVTDYSLTVPYDTATLTVTPQVLNPGATVTVNGTAVASGAASTPLGLAVGENVITIVVTSADGTVTLTYHLVTVRLPLTFTFNSATEVPLTVGDLVAAGNTVSYVLNYVPFPGDSLMMVRNTGKNPIQGMFDNLTHGQLVQLTYGNITYAFVASYFGGTGNDLVLQWANNRPLAWGENSYGQLGNGTTTQAKTAGPVSMTGILVGKSVLQVVAGTYHSLALCADGTAAAWGSNNHGQLGDRATTNRLQPVAVDQSGVLAGKTLIAVTCGDNHTLALCADGALAAWGSNSSGQLGDGTTTNRNAPVLVNTTGVLSGRKVVAIASGFNHNLVLCADGTLAAWGSNGYGQLGNGNTTTSSVPMLVNRTGVLAVKTIVAVAAGMEHCLVMCADHTLAAWGNNNYSQLGDGTTTSSSVPVLVNQSGALTGKSVSTIAAGAQHNLVLCADGTLAGWGANSYGQLGDGNSYTSGVPMAVNQSGVLIGRAIAEIHAGIQHGLVRCADNSLVAWGGNGYGQLGNNSNTTSTVPVLVNNPAAQNGRCGGASAGGYHSLAVVGFPLPLATTLAATAVTTTSARLNGSVNANDNATTVTFEYGLTSGFGNTLAASPTSVTGTTAAGVNANLSGLTPGTTYHYRVVATCPGGITRGADVAFPTPSNNAMLSALALNAGELVPAFDPARTSYLTQVPYPTSGVTVTPVTMHASASVIVNGVYIPKGAASGVLNLAVGANTITTVVTAQDGTTTMSYVIVVNRQPAPDDDSDHDGIPYLVEYAFGLDPLSNSAGQLPQPHMVAKRWEIRFTEPAGVTGITYGAQWSSSLQPGSWTDIPDTGSGAEHVFSVPADESRVFMRLKVTAP